MKEEKRRKMIGDRVVVGKLWLIDHYHNKNLSLYQISKLLNCSYGKVHNLMIQYNIERRSIKEAIKLNPPKINYKRGKEHHFFGKKHTDATKKKISKSNTGRNCSKGSNHFNFGRKHSVEQKEKWSKERSGKNNPAWKGGVTSLYDKIRHCKLYEQWRLKVFKRDQYTCQECGDNKGGNLNADHIKPFALILKEYKIKSFKQAKECNILWDIKNGKTLCCSCHKKTPTFGVKTKKILKEN